MRSPPIPRIATAESPVSSGGTTLSNPVSTPSFCRATRVLVCSPDHRVKKSPSAPFAFSVSIMRMPFTDAPARTPSSLSRRRLLSSRARDTIRNAATLRAAMTKATSVSTGS